MTRARRPRAGRIEISAAAAAWARGEPGAFVYFSSEEERAELWRELGEEVVREHIAGHPGTRPVRWWTYDAPEPRRRLGGVGTPCHERLANLLILNRGIPDDWISADTIATYERLGRPLDVPAVDQSDPPIYESEASYLQRLGLLLPGERRRLVADDFEPVSVIL